MRVPDDVLDATALRPLMEAMIEHSKRAIAQFTSSLAIFLDRDAVLQLAVALRTAADLA